MHRRHSVVHVTAIAIGLLVCTVPTAVGQIGQCKDFFTEQPQESHSYGPSCYYLFANNRNYDDAKQLCSSGQAHILFLESTQERQALGTLMAHDQVWLGIQHDAKSGWYWDDVWQSPIAMPHWATPPDPADCWRVASLDNSNNWMKAVCTNPEAWVLCEKENSQTTMQGEPTTAGPLGQFNESCVTSPASCMADLQCIGGYCRCQSDTYWTGSGCAQRQEFAHFCSTTPEDSCIVVLECVTGLCMCGNSSLYWSGQACQPRHGPGEACTSQPDNSCFGGMICRGGVCECNIADRIWDGQSCVPRPEPTMIWPTDTTPMIWPTDTPPSTTPSLGFQCFPKQVNITIDERVQLSDCLETHIGCDLPIDVITPRGVSAPLQNMTVQNAIGQHGKGGGSPSLCMPSVATAPVPNGELYTYNVTFSDAMGNTDDVTIGVIYDIPNVAPVFVNVTPSVVVGNDVPVGHTFSINFQTYDPDSGVRFRILDMTAIDFSYSLNENLQPPDNVGVTSSNGTATVTFVVKRELVSSGDGVFSIKIEAMDWYGARATAVTDLTVNQTVMPIACVQDILKTMRVPREIGYALETLHCKYTTSRALQFSIMAAPNSDYFSVDNGGTLRFAKQFTEPVTSIKFDIRVSYTFCSYPSCAFVANVIVDVYDSNECVINMCTAGSECVDGILSYTCNCRPGTFGRYCQNNTDECQPEYYKVPCRNGGSCVDGINGYTCKCTPGFGGDYCADGTPIKCSAESGKGVTWPETDAGKQLTGLCFDQHTGNSTRMCGTDGYWMPTDYSSCVKDTLTNLISATNQPVDDIQMEQDLQDFNEITTDAVSSTTEEGKLTAKDLQTSVGILERFADAVDSGQNTATEGITENFLSAASNTIDSSFEDSWKALDNQNRNESASSFMRSVERFGKTLNKTTDDDKLKTRVTPNIVMQVKRTTPKAIRFPESPDDVALPDWTDKESGIVDISKETMDKSYKSDQKVLFIAIFYKTLDKVVPEVKPAKIEEDDKDDAVSVNTQVLSVTIIPNVTEKLDPPFSITFPHLKVNHTDPVCVYWKYDKSKSGGYWSTEGCALVSSDENKTICECNHFTNFAVLMSPTEANDEHTEILSIISAVGCAISIFGLAVTLAVHVFLWKFLKTDKAVLLLNLSGSLLVAYVLFLGGVTQTGSEDGCIVIAALLHFFYLAAFFFMLAEGIDMAISVLYVFATKSRLKYWLILGWGAPVIIVAISLGATQTEGYGNEKYCWLSIYNHLIWAFIIPVLCIILANTIIIIAVLRAMYSTTTMLNKSRKEKAKSGVRSVCVLMPLLGLTWVFGVFSVSEDLIAFQYIFAILNSLQGFAIFLLYVAANAHIKEGFIAWKRSRGRKRGKSYTDSSFIPYTRRTSGSVNSKSVSLSESVTVSPGEKIPLPETKTPDTPTE